MDTGGRPCLDACLVSACGSLCAPTDDAGIIYTNRDYFYFKKIEMRGE
jgi:hypothetical protein